MVKVTLIFFILALVRSGFVLADTPKVEIKVLHMPEECTKKAEIGKSISIHYTGALADGGKEFDSSVGRDPLEFDLGAQHIIAGVEEGVLDMCIGEKRKITIPPGMIFLSPRF
jgi:FKBP-type peptidyl-prolyl cis-trans isomerase